MTKGLLRVVNCGDWLSRIYVPLFSRKFARRDASAGRNFGLKWNNVLGFTNKLTSTCRHCSFVARVIASNAVDSRQKIASAMRWRWFSANEALQFHHLELTSRKNVNKRSYWEYMSRAVSPRLEILRNGTRSPFLQWKTSL